jgi:hypothetical protein
MTAQEFTALLRGYLTDPEWAEVEDGNEECLLHVRLPDGSAFWVKVEDV